MDEMDDLVYKVKNSFLSEKEGALEIMTMVYASKYEFGLGELDEDQLHEFMCFQLKSFERIFDVYDPEQGSFKGFLYWNIKRNLSTWRRKQMRISSGEKTVIHSSEQELDSKMYMYSQTEYAVSCQTEAELDSERSFLKDFAEKMNSIADSADLSGKSHRKNPELNTFRYRKNLRETVLVLFLKSCFYATEDMTEKVSILTGVSPQMLREMAERAIKSVEQKIIKRSELQNARDRAFYFHRRYMLELSNNAPYTSSVEEIYNRYEKQTKRWKKDNKKLEEGKFAVVPPNKIVADILGLTEYRVRYLLSNAEENMDTLSVRQYYMSHENLFSNWKSEQKEGNAGDSEGLHDNNPEG